jgi:uncharacterized protein (TIGR02722 family)
MTMKSTVTRSACATLLAGGLLIGAGCSAFHATTTPMEVDTAKPLDASYDFLDLKWLGDSVANDALASELIRDAKTKPTFVVMGIQNRTARHIDTKAITDTIRTIMINSGKAQFVNEAQRDTLIKEQGYQLSNCTPETRVAIGRQLGAQYMLTGSLVEIQKESPRQARLSKQEQVYYQMTTEITDLQSGLIAWTTQKERLRGTSKPLIGW